MKQSVFEAKKINAVIFDIDGVLVDTEYYQWLGWVEILKPYHKTITKKQYLKYAGKQGDVIESEIARDLALSFRKGVLLAKKEALLINWFHKKELKPMPYAKQTVAYFLKKGFKLAAASGSPKDEALLKLKRTGLLPLLRSVTGSNEVKRGKPFPDIYLHAAKLLDVNPTFCLSFEDTQYGVEAAKAAGLSCFAVPNEFSQKQDFSKADKVFKNLKEAMLYFESGL
jgi:HAD superfamily hydrolase (TIGR01509 family)